MANLPVNQVTLVGKVIRMDKRIGLTRDNREFISMQFTLNINDDQIKVESFAMKLKSDGSETSAYKGLETLFEESVALHKTIKMPNEDKATEVEDETIAQDIEDCTVLKFSNWNGFKYCRMEENTYAKDGQLVKNIRLTSAYPNHVDLSKVEYKPQKDFEICGLVKNEAILMEKDDVEYLQLLVVVPIYQEAWGDRSATVTLNDVTVTCHDESVFDYIQDNFEKGTVVYLNGEIIRRVQRIENEVEVDENRGFGRVMARQKTYTTNIEEYMEIMGGYPLESDEIEEMREFNQELWQVAKELKETKEQEMLNGGERPKAKVGFGKEEKPKTKTNRLPF